MNAHRIYFDEAVRASFADSLDVDEALKVGREQENRWDYLLGHEPSRRIVGIEPHSAENSEITTVIRKLEAARLQLRDHLRDGVFVAKCLPTEAEAESPSVRGGSKPETQTGTPPSQNRLYENIP
jgi:hypothetical protein